MNKNKRRQYWIQPAFQGRYLLQILALEILVAVATALFTFLGAILIVSPGFQAGSGWRAIVIAFVAMLILCAAALAWLGIRISHRFCGPALRMQLDLAAMREQGHPRPIRLRENDELQELANEINKTLAHLAHKN